MKISYQLLTLTACLTAGSSASGGEDSFAKILRHEASLLAIQNDSSKSGLFPTNTSRPSGWRSAISPSLSYQRFGKLNINGRANNRSSMIPSLLGAGSETLPDIGSATSFGDRSYTNGFVNQTGPTADTGRTWFWGYQNESQVTATGDLVMSAIGNRAIYREAYSDPFRHQSSETLDGITPRLDLQISPPSGHQLPFQNILVSLAYFSDDMNNSFTSFTGNQTLDRYRLDFRDTFETSNLILPGAGYSGTAAGPGVTITNLPGSREVIETLTGTETAMVGNVVNLDVDINNLSLAIGPTIEGVIASNWTWQASAGPTFNFYQYKLRQSEQAIGTVNGIDTLIGTGFRDSESGHEFGIGIFVLGALQRQINEQWRLRCFIQAEIAESFEVSNGASSVDIDPSGYSVGLGATFSY